MTIYQTIPELTEAIVQIRQDRDITQKEMAEALRVTQGAIAHLENDTDNTTSLRALIPYAQALGLKITFNIECG